MRKDGALYRFSPTDLVNFMRSDFITWMDRFHLDRPGEIERDADTEEQDLIQKKGVEHEQAFVKSLRAQGRSVCDLSECGDQPEPTLAAMRRGEDIIYQGYLVNGDFAG